MAFSTRSRTRSHVPQDLHLPEDLVEGIFSKMPFPSIFKCRTLSKLWQAKLSPPASGGDEDDGMNEQKVSVALFQLLVADESQNWETFCPVRIGEDPCGYNWASKSWQRLPQLSFLRADRMGSYPYRRASVLINGALVFINSKNYSDDDILSIVNVVTPSWKLLPPRSRKSDTKIYCPNLVSDVSSNSYKVILFCNDDDFFHDVFWIEIYDSRTGSWVNKKDLLYDAASIFCRQKPGVYLNGVLYWLDENLDRLLAFNVEEEEWEDHQLVVDEDIILNYDLVDVVVCNGKLCTVMETFDGSNQLYLVMQIDLEFLRMSVLAQAPLAYQAAMETESLVAHGDYIIFGVSYRNCDPMVTYNVQKNEWDCLPPSLVARNRDGVGLSTSVPSNRNSLVAHHPWTMSAFQPGLNPFVAI